MFYPYFDQGNQSNFRGILNSGNSSAWQGLINSPLYSNSRFRQFDTVDDVQGTYSDDASLVGAMTLFLDGIVPDTGYWLLTRVKNDAKMTAHAFPFQSGNSTTKTTTLESP